MCHYHLRDYSKALDDLQHTLMRDPRKVKAHFYIAKVLTRAAGNARSKATDAYHHLEFCTSREDPIWTGNALYLIARLSMRDLKF